MESLKRLGSSQRFRVLNAVEGDPFGVTQMVWFVISLIDMNILWLILDWVDFNLIPPDIDSYSKASLRSWGYTFTLECRIFLWERRVGSLDAGTVHSSLWRNQISSHHHRAAPVLFCLCVTSLLLSCPHRLPGIQGLRSIVLRMWNAKAFSSVGVERIYWFLSWRSSKTEKLIVLHNTLCYKYVYFCRMRCNQNGKKKGRRPNCWSDVPQSGGGHGWRGVWYKQRKKSVTNYSKS